MDVVKEGFAMGQNIGYGIITLVSVIKLIIEQNLLSGTKLVVFSSKYYIYIVVTNTRYVCTVLFD